MGRPSGSAGGREVWKGRGAERGGVVVVQGRYRARLGQGGRGGEGRYMSSSCTRILSP